MNYFSKEELASKDGAKSPYEHEVQPQLLELLNAIREAWGAPVLVNSAYRSPEHNEKVGGVKNSMHVQGLAADIRPKDLKDLDAFQKLCKEVNANGGTGFYKTFCHVDARGRKAFWDYR